VPAWSAHSIARHGTRRCCARDTLRPPCAPHDRGAQPLPFRPRVAWAVYDGEATPYLLGKTVGGFRCPFNGIPAPADTLAAREQAISYAAYRLLHHRYLRSPNATSTLPMLDSLILALGYDPSFTSTDYASGSPAALGNYIGQSIIDYGLQDGANEQNGYAYQYYQPVNPPLNVRSSGDSTLMDPNRWQPGLPTFIDQNGNLVPDTTPKFLTPEWAMWRRSRSRGHHAARARRAQDHIFRRQVSPLCSTSTIPPIRHPRCTGGPTSWYWCGRRISGAWTP
jgi:hypothetical protein